MQIHEKNYLLSEIGFNSQKFKEYLLKQDIYEFNKIK